MKFTYDDTQCCLKVTDSGIGDGQLQLEIKDMEVDKIAEKVNRISKLIWAIDEVWKIENILMQSKGLTEENVMEEWERSI